MILNAPKMVDYQGTITRRTIRVGADTVRIEQRVVHARPDRDRIDQIDALKKQETVVIRIKDDVYWREPRADSTVYYHRRGQGDRVLDQGLRFSSLDLLRANYDVIIQGQKTMLDRPAVVLAIRPKQRGRLAKVAWIDQQTGLVLRTEDRDETGRLIAESFFTSLTLNPTIHSRLFATDEWANRAVEAQPVIACESVQEVERKAGFPLSIPASLPKGFALESLRVLSYVGRPLVHFTYTDGLSQLSLFERVAPSTDQAARAWPGGTPRRRGAVDLWKRGLFTIMRRHDGTKLYTIISDIDESESIKMIESLRVSRQSHALASSRSFYLSWTAGGIVVVAMLIFGWWVIRQRSATG